MLLQDLQTVLSRRQLVTEVFLRYYDLLSFAEMECEKRQKTLRRSIASAKQKLIFYLSFLKSSKPSGAPFLPQPYWEPDALGIADFVRAFASDKMYQRLNKDDRERLKAQLLKRGK